MSERQFAVSGDWALGADSLQWILYRRHRRPSGKDTWDPLSFVASTRIVLERCMREKGVEAGTARNLIAGLPDTFEVWNLRQSTSYAEIPI